MKNIIYPLRDFSVFLLLLCATFHYSQAQSNQDGFEIHFDDKSRNESKYKDFQVSLDPCLDTNENHPYMSFFNLQDNDYILGLYALNKANSINTPEYYNPAIVIKNQEGNNSLIFTLFEGGVSRYDTVRNTLHPAELSTDKEWDWFGLRSMWVKYYSKRQLNNQNLQGSLPRGVMSYISSSNRKLEFGIQVVSATSEVKIEITTLTGELVLQIVDDKLAQGWQEWSPTNLSRGMYTLVMTVDGQTMSQNFKF